MPCVCVCVCALTNIRIIPGDYGVVIRMNIAAGLGRAVLSPAVDRNRCQLTHICTACWDVGGILITSGTLYI